MRLLVTGANGQIGWELARSLMPLGHVTAMDRDACDLARPETLPTIVRDAKPDVLVNAAGYTAVDQAEREEPLATLINATAVGVLAQTAREIGALLVHYSTDYVFDGVQRTPYDEASPTNPLNVYGASKLEGERAIAASGARALTLRTSWVYGLRGANFLMTIRRLAAERDVLRIVDDQTGVPNWTRSLAGATAALMARGRAAVAERAGLYHLCASGSTTWYGFARAIVGDASKPDVVPISTAEYPLPARRPAYAVLASKRLRDAFGVALPDWRDALAACLARPLEPPR
jgi:dTDP-4-dehydrorhamnose reductase